MSTDKDGFRFDAISEKPTDVIPPFVHVGITYDPGPSDDAAPTVVIVEKPAGKPDGRR